MNRNLISIETANVEINGISTVVPVMCSNCTRRESAMHSICSACMDFYNTFRRLSYWKFKDWNEELKPKKQLLEIDKVIFNGPATVVLWNDGDKTIVKCSENDIFDKEKGLAMAMAKKLYGNPNRFHKEFKKWIPAEEETLDDIAYRIADMALAGAVSSKIYKEIQHSMRVIDIIKRSDYGLKKIKCCETCKFLGCNLREHPCNSCVNHDKWLHKQEGEK